MALRGPQGRERRETKCSEPLSLLTLTLSFDPIGAEHYNDQHVASSFGNILLKDSSNIKLASEMPVHFKGKLNFLSYKLQHLRSFRSLNANKIMPLIQHVNIKLRELLVFE